MLGTIVIALIKDHKCARTVVVLVRLAMSCKIGHLAVGVSGLLRRAAAIVVGSKYSCATLADMVVECLASAAVGDATNATSS